MPMPGRRGRENSLQFLGGHKERGEPLLRDTRPTRHLRALVDSDVWDQLGREGSPADATLHGLLGDERVELSLYSDDGPPGDAERVEADGYLSGEEVIGWTTLTPQDDPMVAYSITTATRSSVHSRALITHQVLTPSWVLREENGRVNDADALLIATAQEIEADVLITRRATVLATELEDRANCRFVSPETALALVALYFRAGGEYILAKSSNFTGSAHRRGFYDRAAAQVMPTLREFVHRGQGTVDSARLLTIMRRARALLEARDRIALLVSEVATDDTGDAVEAAFTHALVDMVATHDLLARVVNAFMPSPETDGRKVKWQREWRRAAVSAIPALEPAWGDGGWAVAVNTALRAIRNEIHDVSPVTAPLRTRWGPAEIGLAFGSDVGTTVRSALATLPDSGEQGIAQQFSDAHTFRPHVFVEFVLPWMLATIEATLASLLPLLPPRDPARRARVLDSEPVSEALAAILHLRKPAVSPGESMTILGPVPPV